MALEHPKYEKIENIPECEELIIRWKAEIVRQDKMRLQTKEQAKDSAAAFRETLKEIEEQQDHAHGVVDALENQRRLLYAKMGATANTIPPMPE